MRNLGVVGAICGTVLLLAVLGGVFALAWHGTVTGHDAIVVVTTIVAIAGGALAVVGGGNAVGSAAAKHAAAMREGTSR